MSKLVTFFILGFIFTGILGCVLQGGGGVATTRLTVAIDADDTTVPVLSTSGFLNIDVITIDNEKILYSSKDSTNFYVADRGVDDTIADSHAVNKNVHSPAAGIVNSMAGYNISVISDVGGWTAFFTLPFAILKLIINPLYQNFNYLGSDMAILTYIWIAMALGLLVTIGISLFSGIRTSV